MQRRRGHKLKAPILLFAITGLAAILVAILRRRHFWAGTIAGIIAAILAILIIYLPMDTPISIFGASLRVASQWQILGRSFALDINNRAAIGYLYLAGGFLLAGAWIARPIRMFFALGLIILALIAASLMISPFLFAAIFLELAAVVSLVILSSRETGRSMGGLRLLTLYTFAMLAILLVGRIIDLGMIEIEKLGLFDLAFLLLGIGFAIYFVIPPFHSWIPISAEDTHPFALTFVTVILQGAALFLLLQFLSNYEWLRTKAYLFQAIRFAGATMAWLAALWSATQDKIVKSGSYAFLSDLGMMLIAVGNGTAEGFQLALGISGVRVVVLACWSFGMSYMKHPVTDQEDNLQNGRSPVPSLAKAAIIFSMLSLAGLPMTAGFPGRWGVLTLLTPDDSYAWAATIFSMAGISLATFRCARFLLMGIRDQIEIKISRKEKIYLMGGIVLGLMIGIFPQLLYPWVSEVISGLIFLSP